METKIKYIDVGTGNRVGNTIYLNKELKRYPKLHDAILEHEKNHSSHFSVFKDIFLDLRVRELVGLKKEYYKFVLSNPRSWVNFFPVMKIEGKWCFDITLLSFWLIVSIIIGVVIWF